MKTQSDLQNAQAYGGNAIGATRASTVYLLLRQDIIRAKLLPGERLRVENLTERYGVGPTPVREALNRLTAEGLVVQQDQRGFRVAPVSVEDLIEVVTTRIWLEEIAIRESIKNGDDAWEEGIMLAYHRLSRIPNRLDEDSQSANPEWESRHHAFHQALIAACPSRTLQGFCKRLFESADRYRHLAVRHTAKGERDVNAEHKALKDAVLARQTDLALRLLKEHTEHTLNTLLKILERDGELASSR